MIKIFYSFAVFVCCIMLSHPSMASAGSVADDWQLIGRTEESPSTQDYPFYFYKILQVNSDVDRYASIIEISVQGDANYYKAQGTYRIRVDNVGIGTTNPQAKLAVNGDIYGKRVKVTVAPQSWPDYVFDGAYKLSSLDEVEHYIKANRHLPDMPAAAVVEKEGHDLGEMDSKLLQKVEELTFTCWR